MDISYGSPTKLQDGRYFVSTSASTGPVYVQAMGATFNPSDDEWSVQVIDETAFSSLDTQLVQDAAKNSVSWFGKEFSKEVIAGYYQSSVDDGAISALPFTNAKGRVSVGYFSEAKDPISSVEAGTTCNILLQLDGLWFLKRSFGPVWKVVQVRVRRPVQTAQCLVRDEDSD
jgi:Family of unknown function (DUF5871)